MRRWVPSRSLPWALLVLAACGGTLASSGRDGGTEHDAGASGGSSGGVGTGSGVICGGGSDACDDSGSGIEDGSLPPGNDGGEGVDAGVPQSNVRLADWVPDAFSAGFDFCLAIHGTSTFEGPQLAAVGRIMFGFPNVTTYFEIDEGQYDLEIVAPSATDCSMPIGTATDLPALSANAYYTIALVGDLAAPGTDPSITAVGYQDDLPPTDGSVNVRFFDEAPSLSGATSLDFGTGSKAASDFSALVLGVSFAALPVQGSMGITVDPRGYVQRPAYVTPTQFSADLGGTTDVATASSQFVAANTSATIALVGGKTGGTRPRLLVCQGDTTLSTTTTLSNCTLVSQ